MFEIVSFSEHDNKAKFEIVIPGLKCSRKLNNMFHKHPDNALILNELFTVSSMNFAIEFNPKGGSYGPEASNKNKVFRFKIERLPSPIKPEKTELKVN